MKKNRQEKIVETVHNRREGVVVLEDIHDPHNAAAILRSCDAFGWQKVYFIFDQEEEYDPRKVGNGSSSSANKWLDFKIFKSTDECYSQLKKEGFEIAATVLNETAARLEEANLTIPKLALVLGNEHSGLSDTAIKNADQKIYIPMRGMVQSLNVSVTAAIILYEVERQRQIKGREKYQLDGKERKKLIKDFLTR